MTQDARRGCSGSKAAHLARLARIHGQVRGNARMVEQDKYGIGVLTQVSAATTAPPAVALGELYEHLNHCVGHAVEAGGLQKDIKLKEASEAIVWLVHP